MYADEVEKDQRNRKAFSKRRSSGIDGKWKHDKFQTVARAAPKRQFKVSQRANERVVPRNITTSSIRGRNAPVATVVTTVKEGPSTLFISNLATTVSQEDLEELFEQYTPEVVSLHYDSNGTSLGTADLVVPPAKVALIKKDLEGVMLDGQQIEVLETNVAKQVSVFDRIKKVGGASNVSFKPSGQRVRVTVKPQGRRVSRVTGRRGGKF